MRPASRHRRLPWMLFAGAGVAAALGLSTWVLSASASGESALAVAAVGTLLLAVAVLAAAAGLALRVRRRPALVRRAVARLVDLGLAAVVALLIGLGVAPLLTDDPGDASEARLVVFLFGLPLLAAVQEALLAAASSGQTVGKRLAGVRIQRLDGTPPGWRASALRAVPLLLVFAPVVGELLVPLVYLWTVAARDRRGLHDRLAGTRVVPA
jgi:uncharacterized RDD family membrane protein YckC